MGLAKEEEVVSDKHPGYGCMYLGDKDLQRIGLKSGDGLLDVLPYKMVNRQEILEQISFMGKMSVFEPHKQKFEGYDAEEVLFVWDPDEEKQPECNFYFCHSTDALNETMQV